MAQFRVDRNEFLPPNTTLFEVVQIADQYGNLIGAANPSGMAVDSFGRARSSQPFTLFDSFHRYQDNGKIITANSVTGATVTHNANQGLIECTLSASSGSFIKRESSRVFSYQPGKSLQIFESFVLGAPKENLRQRYGYFGEQNGYYLEQDGTDVYLVERTYISGSVVNNRVSKADWNLDPLDGNGPSKMTLDLTKAQILFTDIEWLGVGSVRMGFVIDGRLIHCHTFHHANLLDSTYMTTACLPIRAEIENTGTTASSSTLKVICATVISEGGYELRGRNRSASYTLGSSKDIPTSGTFVPIISIRLKDSRSDAVVIPSDVEFFGITNNTRYQFKIIAKGTLTGASWVSAGADSPVEYDISATAITGGDTIATGYVNISAGAGGSTINLRTDDLLRYQLERNSFAPSDKGFVFTLAATGSSNGNDALGAMAWQEIVT